MLMEKEKKIKAAVNGGTTLYLQRLGLYELPKEVLKTTHLKSLMLGNNSLDELPEDIGRLSALTKLVVYDNRLKRLPPSVSTLPLTELILRGNQIEELPDAFCEIGSLRKLDLSYNLLRTLPTRFGELRSLTNLKLGRNNIERLPLSFVNLPLVELDLWGNFDMKYPPFKVTVHKNRFVNDVLDRPRPRPTAERVLRYMRESIAESESLGIPLEELEEKKSKERAAETERKSQELLAKTAAENEERRKHHEEEAAEKRRRRTEQGLPSSEENDEPPADAWQTVVHWKNGDARAAGARLYGDADLLIQRRAQGYGYESEASYDSVSYVSRIRSYGSFRDVLAACGEGEAVLGLIDDGTGSCTTLKDDGNTILVIAKGDKWSWRIRFDTS